MPDQGTDDGRSRDSGIDPRDSRPIEPESAKLTRPSLYRWILFLLVVLYMVFSYYRAPLLTRAGAYLIVRHEPQRSDLIVCLAGGGIERGLAAADAYHGGLAPRIFIAREELPDGYETLLSKGVHYPESREMTMMILRGLGVPDSALLTSDQIARSTMDEAGIVRSMAGKAGYGSLILITSPPHSRRCWLTFRKVFEKDKVRILSLPSTHSGYKAETWWKERRYQREVIIEYQKLLFYLLKYIL